MGSALTPELRRAPREEYRANANRTISCLELFNYKSWKEILWKGAKFNVYLIFHCCWFWQLLWWSIYCRAGLSLPSKVIRVMHDSAIFPARCVLCSLLPITHISYSRLSRVKAEIHFLLIKVRKPVYMQTLTLWSLGDSNRLQYEV